MNWTTLLELLGTIALCEVIYLPLTWHLWRVRETWTCETFRLTDAKEFAVHAAETQVVNCRSISAG